ncbi:MAG: hypothetical protein WBG73_24710 [Coleofasciculaceae cyanobacterium]
MLHQRGLNPFSKVINSQPSLTQLLKPKVRSHLAGLSLLGVLGLTAISWLGTEAIAPQSAFAYTARLNVSVSRQPEESYRSFVRRAEAVARAAAQRSFDRDILVSDVSVTIIGQNNGSIAPILDLKVSRQNWRRRPDASRWATYFPDTQTLLNFSPTNQEQETGAEGNPPPVGEDNLPPAPNSAPPAGTPNETTPGRVIELPGGVRLIPNPGGRPQTGAPNRRTSPNGATPQNQQQPGLPDNGTNQQNTTPNRIVAPTNRNNPPAGAAPGQVIEIPGGGGVRLIPNPGGVNPGGVNPNQ